MQDALQEMVRKKEKKLHKKMIQKIIKKVGVELREIDGKRKHCVVLKHKGKEFIWEASDDCGSGKAIDQFADWLQWLAEDKW